MTALAAAPEHVTVTPDGTLGDLNPRDEVAAQADRLSVVGVRVRLLRGERGLSQRALAQAAGVDRQAVRRVEAGRGGTHLTTLWGIADGLGVYMADLIAEPGGSRLDRLVTSNSSAEYGDVPMPNEADDSTAFLRRLEHHENVTVSVEGSAEVDASVVRPPPSQVVVRMPDAEADYFAHLIAGTVRAADALGGVDNIGQPERELAEALHEAAATSYRRKYCDLP